MTFFTRTPAVCGLALLCCLLWGSAFPCIKIGYDLFQIPSGSIGWISETCQYPL